MLNFGYPSLAALVRQKAEKNGAAPLLLYEGDTISYAAFDDLTSRAASAFARMGLGVGDRVVLLMWNDPLMLVCWLGLARLGCWVAFINPHYRGQSLDQLVGRIRPRLAVMDADLAQEAASLPRLRAVPIKVSHRAAVTGTDGAVMLSGLIAAADPTSAPMPNLSPGDIAGMIHTSGTTGVPKFCLLSHNYYLSLGVGMIRELGLMRTDRIFLSMPLYHSHKHFIEVMLADASVALSPRFSVSRYWTEVRDSHATLLLLHDQPLVMLLKAPEGPLDRAHGARAVLPGFRRQREFRERFGVEVINMFGSNETSNVALQPWYRPHVDPHYYDTESPGMEIMTDSFEVKIVDDNDADVPPGTIGEIVARQKYPHTMFEGYFEDEAKTAEVFRGGWYHYGDLGRIDERGFLHYAGRKAQNIRHRGEWISRDLVENVALDHPAVSACALVGVESNLGDEELKLYVVLKDVVSPEELLDHLGRDLPYSMVPRYVEFVDSLPRTPGLEKIAWQELKARGIGSAWDRDKSGYKLRRRSAPSA